MSDLIDFDSPSANGSGVASVQKPLIPPPEPLPNDATTSADANGDPLAALSLPPVSAADSENLRRFSLSENNPFDLMMKKVVDYERNRDDPFENVVAMSVDSDDACLPKRARRYSAIKDDDIDMSIITDLNDTNLINESKSMPKIVLSAAPADLSILNSSAMNDSLSDNLKPNNLRPRILSSIDPYLSPRKSPDLKPPRRSLSVTDSLRTSLFGEDSTLHSAQSSMFEDPLNIAFRKFSLKSNASSNISLNNQSDSSTISKKCERLSSDSSVFSGVSNISTIPNDSLNKIRHCSDNSVFSGISNLSIIPKSNTSSCDSAISNDTINKGFLLSGSRLNSTGSTIGDKSSCDQSDLIRKFYAIKKRMSTSLMESQKTEVNQKNDRLAKSMMEKEENNKKESNEKLIDLTNSSSISKVK